MRRTVLATALTIFTTLAATLVRLTRLHRFGKVASMQTVGQNDVTVNLRKDLNEPNPNNRTVERHCLGLHCPFGFVFDARSCGNDCQHVDCCLRKEKAPCTAMLCPPGFVLKENAKNLQCEWNLCASEIRKSQPDWIETFDTCHCCEKIWLNSTDKSVSHFGFAEIHHEHCVGTSQITNLQQSPVATSYHCYGAGNTHWPPPPGNTRWFPVTLPYSSRSFGITNVRYVAGFAMLFSKRHAIRCLDTCDPTFWDNEKHRRVITKYLKKNASKAGKCTAFEKVALVTNYKWPNNLYHWVFDDIFLTYLHLEEYSLHLGIGKDSIEIVCFEGPPESRFIELWASVMRRPIKIAKLDGCYRSVIYGGMWNQRLVHWPATTGKFLADPVIMARMSAFSTNQRSFFAPLLSTINPKETASLRQSHRIFQLGKGGVRSEVIHSCRVIVAGHDRMPSFMKNYMWSSAKVGHGSCVIYRELEQYSVKEQLVIVMQAEAMIGILGAQFSWQVWMKATSPVLVIQAPFPGKYSNCEDLPESWHETTALHCGRTAVSWRFCGGMNEFKQARPVEVIRFTLDLARAAAAAQEAFTCIMLRQVEDAIWHSLPWPYCDVNISIPWSATRVSSCRWCRAYKLYNVRTLANNNMTFWKKNSKSAVQKRWDLVKMWIPPDKQHIVKDLIEEKLHTALRS